MNLKEKKHSHIRMRGCVSRFAPTPNWHLCTNTLCPTEMDLELNHFLDVHS